VFTPVETADGSSTFYSETFGEWFHNRNGACHEAQETYAQSIGLVHRAQNLPTGKALKILDICYGLGYNTAAALETIWGVNPDCVVEIKALEIDLDVARSAIAQNLLQHYSPAVQTVLSAIASEQSAHHQNTHIQLLLGDARQQIQPLISQGWQADVIFLDPFSPPHCPQLWTADFLSLVAQCLTSNDGELATYSCAAAVRSALLSSGLSISSLQTSARKWPGTVAFHPAATSPQTKRLSLSQQEKEHLQTRAAVPYRDPSLCASAEEIRLRRTKEQQSSELAPTGPWRSRWKHKALSAHQETTPERHN